MDPTTKRYLTGGLLGLTAIAALAVYARQERRIEELEDTLRWMLASDLDQQRKDQ